MFIKIKGFENRDYDEWINSDHIISVRWVTSYGNASYEVTMASQRDFQVHEPQGIRNLEEAMQVDLGDRPE